jgi:uncharacterized damage-inducible protein DinB
MSLKYRIGALGALMDEYERAAADLIKVIEQVTQSEFQLIRDTATEDEDCRSIQTIMTHVVRSGYGYAISIRKSFGIDASQTKIKLNTPLEAITEFEKMLSYSAETFNGRWGMSYDEIDNTAVVARSGKKYDIESMMEHAIVHILRHRRQIEKFLAAA